MPAAPILTWEQLAARGQELAGPAGDLLGEIIHQLAPSTDADPALGESSWYLAELTVGGFIGIGQPPVRLDFKPGPGLTVVTARNGVGKSSLAWGLRHLLGGAALGRSVDAELGVRWVNLHSAERLVHAVFTARGGRTVTLVDEGAGPGLVGVDGERRPVPAAWAQAKTMFEPVLIYSEVALAMEDDRKVNSAWVNALALEVLQAVLKASEEVQQEHKDGANRLKNAQKQACAAQPEYAALPPTEAELGNWNAEPLRARMADLETQAPPPSVPAIADELPVILDEFEELVEGLAAARAAAGAWTYQLAELYQLALERPREDGDPCPLCGSTDREWRNRASEQQAILAEVEGRRQQQDQLADVRTRLLSALPTQLQGAATHDDLRRQAADVEQLWDRVRQTVTEWDLDNLSAANVLVLRGQLDEASERHRKLVAVAQQQVADSGADPRVQAVLLRQFVGLWEDTYEDWLRNCAAAELSAWLRKRIQEARDVRSVELGEEAIEHFSRLFPDGGAILKRYLPRGGVAKQQRMDAQVRLGEAEGGSEVLSTGQRNALCLAAFIPRTLRDENPFKFIALDDPVQAFDGERVGYVAELLADIAEHHQVIVLTHDERLPNELRSSGRRFTQMFLDREPPSSLSVERIVTPADALLDDAEEIAKQQGLGQLADQALAVSSLSFCRQAVDAALSAAHDRLRARRPELGLPQGLEGDTVRERKDNLNGELRRAGLAEFHIDEGLMKALNRGSHFDPPADVSSTQRQAWVCDARAAVADLDGLGPALP